MQLGTSTIPLLPAVAVGVAVVLAGLVLLGVRRARRRPAPVAVTAARSVIGGPDPCAEDWTGEAASGAADPPALDRRPTVADAVAARRADTDPFPAVPWPPERAGPSHDPEPSGRPRHALAESVAPTFSGPWPDDATAPSPVDTTLDDDADPDDRTGSVAVHPALDDTGPGPHVPAQGVPAPGIRLGRLPAGDVPDLAEDTDGLDMAEPDPVPPPWSAARSTRLDPAPASVGLAVQHALAAREMKRAQTGGAVRVPSEPDRAQNAQDDRAREDHPDARDRLLAVLLADPAAALGATEQLGDVLRRRRVELAAAVRRLQASGLTREQIGRLADLGDDDVRELLERGAAEDSEER